MRINSVGAGPLPSCKMLLRQISQTNQQASSHLPTARQRRSVAIRRHGSRRLRAQTRSSGAACRSGPNTVVFRSSNKIDKNNDRKVCADKPHPRSAQESRSFSSFPKAPAASGRVKQVSDYTSARISAWRWYYTTAAAPGDPGTGLWTKNGVVKYFSNPHGVRAACLPRSRAQGRGLLALEPKAVLLAGSLSAAAGFGGLSSGPAPCCES
jgi:hypothetical protein